MPKHGYCKHCKKFTYLQSRGLCQRDFSNKEIRKQYPLLTGRTEEDTARDHEPEPTEEELEAMIAEQMKNLPDWWHETEQRHLQEQARRPSGIRVCKLVRRGSNDRL